MHQEQAEFMSRLWYWLHILVCHLEIALFAPIVRNKIAIIPIDAAA